MLVENGGTDATTEFNNVNHSDVAKQQMKKYVVGKLKK